MFTRIPFTLLATALACSVFAAPALALRARVFVSAVGVDSGNCSFGAPCRTLTFALSAVEAGGEITMIDSAGYDPLTITKPVTITSPDGVEAGITAGPGGNAITINTTGDVFLRGLTIDGNDAAANGIFLASNANDPSTISIVHCVVRHFTTDGINLDATSNFIGLTILNTIASNNGHDGITLNGANGEIKDTVTDDNGNNGVTVSTGTVTIVNSVSNNNHNDGFNASTLFGIINLRDSAATQNLNSGVHADVGSVILAHSLVGSNTRGILLTGNPIGQAFSFGDNHIFSNTQGTASLQSLPFQ
jgi:hypothetical protein